MVWLLKQLVGVAAVQMAVEGVAVYQWASAAYTTLQEEGVAVDTVVPAVAAA